MTKATQRRYAALDGLRGIAALVVFAIHVWIYQLPNTVELRRDSWEKTLLFEGRVAFVMFFVLSGYLLYRAFARAALGRSGPVAVGSYLVRRAARITPAYYLALAGTLVLLALAGDVPGRRLVDAGELPMFFLFAQNYSPDTLLKLNAATWTLTVEVVFYLLLPLIGLAALRLGRSARRQALLLGALAVAGLAWNYVDYLAGWGPVASHAAIAFLPYFACGMLVALLVEARRAKERPPLGTVVSGGLVAAAGGGPGGQWPLACERGPHQPRDGGVRGLRCGGGLRRRDRISGARHRNGRALDGLAPARLDGRDHVRLLSVAHPAAGVRARHRRVAGGHRARVGRAAGRDRVRRGELVLRRAPDHAPRGKAAAGAGRRHRASPAPQFGKRAYRSQVRTIAFANPSP